MTQTIVPFRAVLAGVGLGRIAQGLTAGTPVQVTQIALGTGGSVLNNLPRGYAPDGNELGLRNEVVRVDISAASQVGAKEWMVEASFPPLAAGAQPQWITEAAAFASDGTLIGIWSRENAPIFARVDTSVPLVGFTVSLQELPANAVTFVGVGAPSVHLSILSMNANVTASVLELQRRVWVQESNKMVAAMNAYVKAA